MLSVTVPPHAAIRILETERDDFSRFLKAVGTDRPLWEADEAELAAGSPADELWQRLTGLHDVGPVIAGKLMASKRPNLIPVYDQDVYAALGWPRGQFGRRCGRRWWVHMRRQLRSSTKPVSVSRR